MGSFVASEADQLAGVAKKARIRSFAAPAFAGCAIVKIRSTYFSRYPGGARPLLRQRGAEMRQSGAVGDALSTAFFVMEDGEVEEFCRRHPEVGGVLERPDGKDVWYGSIAWPQAASNHHLSSVVGRIP